MKIQNFENIEKKIKENQKIENIELLNKINNKIKENDIDKFKKYISQSRYNHNISLIEYINLRDLILSKKDLSKKFRIKFNHNQSYFISKDNQYKILDFIDLMNKILSKEIFDDKFFEYENNIIEKIIEKMNRNNNQLMNNQNLIDNIYIDEYIKILFKYYIKKYSYDDLFIIEKKIEYYKNIQDINMRNNNQLSK